MWLVLGGMLVLQSSEGLAPEKLAYLAGVAVAGAVSVVRWPTHIRQPWARPFRLVGYGCCLLAGVVLISASVGLVRGESLTNVARDALTYSLIVVGLPISLDAAAALRRRTAERLAIAVALLAAVGFATAWTARRGVSEVGVDQFLLASTALMAVGVALAITKALSGSRIRWAWLVPLPVIVSAPLITGTRSGLLLLLGVFSVVRLGDRRKLSSFRLMVGIAAAAGALLALLQFLGPRLTTGNFIEQRLVTLQAVFSGGLSADQSGRIRLLAFRIATDEWNAFPLLGRGFGHVYPNPNDLMLPGSFQLDTPILLLAKFGLLGSGLLLGGLVLVLSPMWTAKRLIGGRLPEQAVLRGFSAIMLGVLAILPPTEDKGFALSLPLLLLLVGAALRERLAEEGPASSASSSAGQPSRLHGRRSRSRGRVTAQVSRPEVHPLQATPRAVQPSRHRQPSMRRGTRERTSAGPSEIGIPVAATRSRRGVLPPRGSRRHPLPVAGVVRGSGATSPRPIDGQSEPVVDRG
ncbi:MULTISPECIES: O-antigen ligase family protein [unclassified Blastococcus]